MLAIRDLMREVGGRLQPACPSCGKTLRVTRITPRSSGRTGPADLWVSAMRLLANGSCRGANRLSRPALLRFFSKSGQVVTHSPIVVPCLVAPSVNVAPVTLGAFSLTTHFGRYWPRLCEKLHGCYDSF